VHILEVGCGTAPNLWFAAREGFSVAGVDGAESAITAAQQRFQSEGLVADLRVADFTTLPFEDNSFDLVIDRCSLTCCGAEMAKQAVVEIRRVLKTGGRFLFNPYSDRHSSASSGRPGLDGVTIDISAGSMIGVGQLCFYGRQQVIDALKGFKFLDLQHIESVSMLEPTRLVHAEWRAVAEKI
jgi:ubiquinone/menaquinone biosynthesis C-methylase UbiE